MVTVVEICKGVESLSITERASTDFLVVTILPEEMNALKQYGFSLKFDQESGAFYHKTIRNDVMKRDVEIIHYSIGSPGNVDSAVLVSNLLNQWAPKCVVVLGIAAGYHKNGVRIGDILVGSDVVYYSLTKELSTKSERRPKAFPADNTLVRQIQSMADRLGRLVLSSIQQLNGIPTIHTGPILCGESLLKAKNKAEDLLEIQPKAIGLEMESYGVYNACHSHSSRPRVITIRGVSDYGDEEKDDTHHDQASNIAALFFLAYASTCQIDNLSRISIEPIIDRSSSTDTFNYQTDNASVYNIDKNETDYSFVFQGESHNIIHDDLKLYRLREIHPEQNSRIQLGAEIDLRGVLRRSNLLSYSGISLSYILLDPYFHKVAQNIVYTGVLGLPLDDIEFSFHEKVPLDRHLNLLGFLNFDYRVPLAHSFFVGVLIDIGLARGGIIEGNVKIKKMRFETY